MNTYKKIFYFSTILFFYSGFSYAQNINLLLRKGNTCYRKGQYKNAAPYYDQVLKTDPENIQALYKSGVCNLFRYSKEQALINFEKVLQKDSSYDKYLYYWLGRANQLNFNFDQADFFYTAFQQKTSKNKIQYKEVERYKYQLKCARNFVANPANYKIQNLGAAVNSSFSDHSPVVSYTDTLLFFTSRRVTNTEAKEEHDGEPFEDIFYSYRNSTGEWSKPELFHLNTSGHDATIQLFDNDTKIFIYSYLHDGDILLAQKNAGTWSTPMPVKEINSADFESDAFMTADGKTLYYATNHFKKNGDLDICFIAKKDDNTWSKPQTLSSLINTDEDEDAPYISADGKTMYFSSRGHTSMGGYDIFKSELDSVTGQWQKPVNLGYPVNTPDEDLYFCLSAKTKRAFMSSYRTGGFGEKDIYEIIPVKNIQLLGSVMKGDTSTPFPNVTMQYIPMAGAMKGAQKTQVNTLADGTYTTELLSDNAYLVYISQGKDTLLKDTLVLPLNEFDHYLYKQLYILNIHDTAAVKDSVIPKVTDTIKTIAAAEIAKTVYFESNRADLNAEAKTELNQLGIYLDTHKEANVYISGHADALGSAAINNALSQKRAQAAAVYLKAKGISAARIKVESFGSEKPVETNATVEGRAKNRRVQIVVK
jgi:outer membrane protein OmpA-like peptidoglycan-associated protein/tetratricopeptide (TPR) repeat protein